MSKLRRKLGRDLIGTVRGMGYRLDLAALPQPQRPPGFDVAERLPSVPG